MKKGPMYSSNISNSEYDFADYTTPPPPQGIQNLGKLCRMKNSAVLNSQLLDIQESREEDTEQTEQLQNWATPISQKLALEESQVNNFSNHLHLDTHRSVKKAETLKYEQTFPSKNVSKIGGIQNSFKYSNNSSSSLPRRSNEYTSRDVIEMMANPYRDSMEMLLNRLSKPKRIL